MAIQSPPPNETVEIAQKLILSRKDVQSLGVWQSNQTLLRMEARGAFPRRLKIGGTACAWDKQEVLEWLEDRRIERATWRYADAS
jgi:predicted DNA-binding transcriptional regulator AlpA